MMPLTDTDLLSLYRQLYALQAEVIAVQQELQRAEALIQTLQAQLPHESIPQRELTQQELDMRELAALRQGA